MHIINNELDHLKEIFAKNMKTFKPKKGCIRIWPKYTGTDQSGSGSTNRLKYAKHARALTHL
jgi:hypothetical protein